MLTLKITVHFVLHAVPLRHPVTQVRALHLQTIILLPLLLTRAASAGGLLGFCIPIVGLILFLVWKDNKPKTAKAAGMGALICVIIVVVFYIIALAAGVGAAMMY